MEKNSRKVEKDGLLGAESIEKREISKKIHANSAKTRADSLKQPQKSGHLGEMDDFGENGEANELGKKNKTSDFKKVNEFDEKSEEFALKNGAIFISDAHENEDRQGFLNLLKALNEGKITTPQLIIMGDMFDFLVGEITTTHEFAKPYVKLLESIAAQGVQVLYLEGNHDFNLARFFEKVRIFTLKTQPLTLKCEKSLHFKRAVFAKEALKFDDEKAEFKGVSCLLLAHGDIFLPFFLGLCLRFLRTPPLLKILNVVDKIALCTLSKKIKADQKAKNLFYAIDDFKQIATERYARYGKKGALVIEGHYHQDAFFSTRACKYLNLPAFAQENALFVAEFEQN